MGQRVYGIWDRPAFAAGTRTLPRGTGTLAARTLTRLSNGSVVVSSATTLGLVNADASNAQDGWYFQLPGSSEMVLSNVEFRANNIFFSTVRSAPTTTCSNTPLASFYLLDPNSGLARLTVQGATVVNGVLTAVMATDVADQKLRVVGDTSSRRYPPGGGTSPGNAQPPGSGALVCPDGTAAARVIGESTDLSKCFPLSSARFQWREIPGLRTQ